MIIPVQYDLHVFTGTTFRATVEWRDSNDAPVNLTGRRVFFQIRPYASSGTVIEDFDSAALAIGQTLGALGVSGVINFTLSDALTKDYPPGIAEWALLVEAPDGTIDPLAFGKVYISALSTREE